MLTNKQKKWLEHLSESNTTKIAPFSPQVITDFQELKLELEKIVGKDSEIALKGSSNFGISGKGELDVYIPVAPDKFDSTLQKLIKVYGEPGSHYPNERARFNKYVNGTKAEVFLINREAEGWLQLNIFEDWLKHHTGDLRQYEKLKAKLEGKSTREYYTEKTIFFNSIIKKATVKERSGKVK